MRIRHVPLRALGLYGRYRDLAGFSFGTTSQYQPSKDCPVGGSWEAWCDCVFQPGTELNTRCRSKPVGPALFAAPWTEVGAGARGLPKPDSLVASITSAGLQIVSNITGGAVQGPPQPPIAAATTPVQSANITVSGATTSNSTGSGEEPSIFGIPKTIAYVGGGVLALGVAALAFGGRRR